jgi:two-component system response regulator HydG
MKFAMGSIKASTVCVLDDNFSVRKAICRLLTADGWKVEAFADPIEFVRHAEAGQIAVAVIDMIMPRMNGLLVQTELRRVSPATRVIILTSADDPAARATAMAAGAFAYFPKPVDPEQLLTSVSSAFSR